MNPLVTIIIPCYNQGQFLSEAIESVICQTYNNWECIIVNDGSSDNSEEVALAYSKKDTRISYLSQKNQGPSAARNHGIQTSHGEYILPLDADDLISSTYIEKAISYFTEHPETKLVYCRADKFGLINEEWNLPTYNYNSLIWENSIFNAAIYRRSDYDKIDGGYNEMLRTGYEDWDFYLSLLEKEDIVYKIDETLFHYRIHTISRNIEVTNNPYDTLVLIAHRHPEIYQQYWDRILALNTIHTSLQIKVDSLKRSLAYRIGTKVIKPYRWIKKKLKYDIMYNM